MAKPLAPATDRVRLFTRRRVIGAVLGSTALLLLSACGGATAPAQPKPDAKPAEPPKPADAPKPAASAAAPAATPAQAAPAAKAGGLPNLKGTTLSVVSSSSFVPENDPFFKKQVEEGFMRETGAQVTMEFIGNNDLQTKLTASIQGGAGPDIFMLFHNWAHLYKDALLDVSDITADIKKVTGEYYGVPEAYSKVEGKYLAVPRDIVGTAVHWRKSWFKEVGVESFPKTYDEMHAVGKKLKEKGRPLGASLGHSTGDPVFWVYPLVWAYGGQEVDDKGKVAINSPGTVAAVTTLKQAWKDAFDETGLAWDDSANNRAFLAETVSATQNGASIWWVARKDKQPFLDDIGLDFIPAGPKGDIRMVASDYYGVMKYSKNADAAKAFLKWCMSDEIWMPWFELGASYYSGVGEKQNNNPLWEKFPPATRVFKKAPENARAIGWPGPADSKVALVQSKYILVDMFAKAVQGESPESAVAWAEKEMKDVYGG
ncbi:MAG: extracellular solute-binding protein [Chloroflexota bacterium]